MNPEAFYDDVLLFYVNDLRGQTLVRVIRHDAAAALYPHLVNSATGLIHEGDTVPRDDTEVSFMIRRAPTIGLPTVFTRSLLGLHAQMMDYELTGQAGRCEGYADWLKAWRTETYAVRLWQTIRSR